MPNILRKVGPITSQDLVVWAGSITFCAMGVYYSHVAALRITPHAVLPITEGPWTEIFFWAMVLVSVFLRGTAIAGAVILTRRCLCRTCCTDWQPGHYLVLVLGVQGLTACFTDATANFDYDSIRLVTATTHAIVLWVLTPLFFIFLAWKITNSSWKTFFSLSALAAIVAWLTTLQPLARSPISADLVSAFLVGGLFIYLLALAITELIAHAARDWVHWLGVGVALGFHAVATLWGVWLLYY